MNARTKLFPQLSKLQGKLQLVMSQVSAQAEAIQSVANPDAEALLLYQDSSSEDEQIEDELIPSHSEFDGDENIFSDEDEEDEDDEEMIEEDKEKDSDEEVDDDDDDDDDEDDEDDDEEASDEDVKIKPKLANIKNNLIKKKELNNKTKKVRI